MVSSLGIQLGQNRLITGFGMHRHHRVRHHGRGVTRRAVGSVVGALGHALVNRVASAISGGSYKLSGQGRRRRAPRTTLSGGYKHRVHRYRVPTVGGYHRRVGGYHRRVGRPRKPRTTLSGYGHRRVHHHRHRLMF